MSDSNLTDALEWLPEAKAKLKNIPFLSVFRSKARIEQLLVQLIWNCNGVELSRRG